jgi:hypothetical protein
MRPRPLLRWSETTGILLLTCVGMAPEAQPAVIHVPEDVAGIQAAITAAHGGDTVLVAPGTYAGGLSITGKAITLTSRFITTSDPNDIAQTILDGGAPILGIQESAGAATTVRGLTFQNGDYQVVIRAPYCKILDNHFLGGTYDQVSFESGGGLVRNCLFVNPGDDGIDSDHVSNPTIEDNTIQGAGNDGIEIRLHDYTGPMLEIAIRRNRITGSVEDGIQLIDYPGATSRLFRIELNVLAGNGKAGLGCMANGATTENFAGAPLEEDVRVFGNTFSGNRYGLTGGDHMLVMNNIFVGTAQIGVKQVAGTSIVSRNIFWSNGTDYTTSNVDVAATLFQDPRLDANFNLLPGSPCIDAGEAATMWDGNPVNAPPYKGDAPDLGAHEGVLTVSTPSESPGVSLALRGVLPNPSASGLRVAITLPDASPARIDVMDLAGRRMLARDLSGLGPGRHEVRFPDARALAAGVYVVRLSQGGRSVTTRAIVIR